MSKTLIVGFGNPDRQDDGAAWHTLYGLAQRLGRPLPEGPEEGFLPEGEEPDLWFVLQLVPEMAETFAGYERVLFIDAHTGQVPHDLLFQPVAQSGPGSSLTHHLSPQACMALVRSIYFRSPLAFLLTIRGYSFQFERQLSPQTAQLVQRAIEIAWNWTQPNREEI